MNVAINEPQDYDWRNYDVARLKMTNRESSAIDFTVLHAKIVAVQQYLIVNL